MCLGAGVPREWKVHCRAAGAFLSLRSLNSEAPAEIQQVPLKEILTKAESWLLRALKGIKKSNFGHFNNLNIFKPKSAKVVQYTQYDVQFFS